MFLYYPYFICLLANIEICFSQNHRAMGKSKKNSSSVSYQSQKGSKDM